LGEVNVTQGVSTLLIGSSGGVGGGFLSALTNRGDPVKTLSRSGDGFDIADPESIEKAARSLADTGATFQRIIVASGILDVPSAGGGVQGPEKSFSALTDVHAITAFQVNALGPALVYKYFADLMPAKQRAVFVALSARVGSIGDNRLGGWMSYRASKAALNQFMRCASVEHQRRHPEHIVACMHPGTIPTALTEKYAKGRYTDDPIDAARRMLSVMDDFNPDDNGGFFAYDGKTIEW